MNKEKEQDNIQAVNKEQQEQNDIQQQEQEDIEAVIIGDNNKHNEEQEQEDIGVVNKEQEQNDIQAVNEEQQEQDNIQAVNEDEQEQDNIQVVNEEEQEEQEQDKGYSGITKKRRQFTLQEKLMYLRVIHQKVDKGFSLQEASKSINISHKQILDWKKQAVTMKNKNNQQAKSLGDGVTFFLSPHTDKLLSFIFKMRETGMAVSVNLVILKALQLSREFREKTYIARHSAMCRFINVHGFVHWMGTHLHIPMSTL